MTSAPGQSDTTSGAVEAYSLQTGSWSTLASLPTPRYRPAAAVGSDGRIYVVGGTSDTTSASALSTVEAYDPGTNSWTCSQGDTGTGCSPTNSTIAPLPTGRNCPGVATGADGRIYVIAGAGATSFSTETDAYDPSTNTWTTLAPVPVLYVECVSAVESDGKIYLLGPDVNGQDALEIYDPSTNSWTAGAPYPSNVFDAAVATGPDGMVYVFGGAVSSNSNDITDAGYAYDPESNTWSPLPAISLSRACGGAALGGDGRIYLVGGEAIPTQANSFLSSIVESYDPATKQWNDEPLPFAGNIDDVIRDAVFSQPTDRSRC